MLEKRTTELTLWGVEGHTEITEIKVRETTSRERERPANPAIDMEQDCTSQDYEQNLGVQTAPCLIQVPTPSLRLRKVKGMQNSSQGKKPQTVRTEPSSPPILSAQSHPRHLQLERRAQKLCKSITHLIRILQRNRTNRMCVLCVEKTLILRNQFRVKGLTHRIAGLADLKSTGQPGRLNIQQEVES